MAVNILEFPEVIGAQTCQEICFDVTDVVAQASSDKILEIPVLITERFQIGTSLSFNGNTFTFVSSGTGGLNNVPFTTLQASINALVNNLSNNFCFQDCIIDKITDAAGGCSIVITCPCHVDISLQIEGLTGTPDVYNASAQGDNLILHDCHQVALRINSKNSDCATELNIPVQVTTDCTGCKVESVQAKKDISLYLQPDLVRFIPDCDSRTQFIQGAINTVTFDYAESIAGSKGALSTSSEVTVLNTNVCEPEIARTQLTTMQEGYQICCATCLKTYLAITREVSVALTITTDEGSRTIDYGTFDGCGILEISVPITNCCDITFVDYQVIVTDGLTIIPFNSIRLDIVKDSAEQFKYLNDYGTFSDFCTSEVINSNVSDIKEYIELCRPCKAGPQEKGAQVVSHTSTRQFIVNIDTRTANFEQYNEFLCSNEVYWCRDGQLYLIQKVSNNYQDVANQKPQTIQFAFTVAPKSSIC